MDTNMYDYPLRKRYSLSAAICCNGALARFSGRRACPLIFFPAIASKPNFCLSHKFPHPARGLLGQAISMTRMYSRRSYARSRATVHGSDGSRRKRTCFWPPSICSSPNMHLLMCRFAPRPLAELQRKEKTLVEFTLPRRQSLRQEHWKTQGTSVIQSER